MQGDGETRDTKIFAFASNERRGELQACVMRKPKAEFMEGENHE
jgi:hypothetical protein